MLDFHHVPTRTNADVQEFTNPSTATNVQWQTWRKPRGASMVNIVCVGGGGGGGGGFTAIAGSARGGGGGGGASAQSIVTVAAHLVPDVLFVQVGAGGGGVSVGTAGSGVLSYVSVDSRATTANNILCVSGTAAATGGGSGSGAAVGPAGTAGSVATLTIMPLAALGNYTFIAGTTGTAGGSQAGAVGGAQTLPTSGAACLGGTGGGGSTSADYAGGLITAIAGTLVSDSRPQNALAGSNNGSGGFNLRNIGGYFFAYGGMGGGSSNASVGGQGGNGFHGSGGGGGGAGTTGGTGGRGGDGIVIITSW